MNDPITESLEAQSRFYEANPRDESITNKAGWQERYELMQASLPENAPLCREHDDGPAQTYSKRKRMFRDVAFLVCLWTGVWVTV